MKFWDRLIGRKNRRATTKARGRGLPPLWEEGKANPTGLATRVSEDGSVSFFCPTCEGKIVVPSGKIDDRRGALWSCGFCQDHFYLRGHVPGSPVPKGAVITSGVLVAISAFGTWYLHHPVYIELGDDSWMLNEHGLWGFCEGCGRQFISTVLCALVNYHIHLFGKRYGARDFIFGANTAESAREMEALQSGTCQQCGSKNIVAIMACIQQNLREDFRRAQKA